MANLSLIPGGACLEFDNRGHDARAVRLYALGMPHDHRPTPPPSVHGEASGSESFFLPDIHYAERLCSGGIALMRVGFVPERIVRADDVTGLMPGHRIFDSRSWRLGSENHKADVFRLDRGHVAKHGMQGVGFLAADSGFCQIAMFHAGLWLCSYFVHIGFYNLAPKANPQGISLIDAVVEDIKRANWGMPADDSTLIRTYYGMGICPEWYGVGDDYVKHIIARYGEDAGSMLRTPSAGPRKDNAQSISLKVMLDAEFDRSGIKEFCDFEQLSFEGPATCPAAMHDTEGNPILWSAVREADKSLDPHGNPLARNLVFITLPQ
jgi:hypothetical protein